MQRDNFRRTVEERIREVACASVLNPLLWAYLAYHPLGRLLSAPGWALTQALHQQFCGLPLPPELPPLNWPGGQCPVLYEVFLEWRIFRRDGVPDPDNYRKAKVVVLGPVVRVGFFQEFDPEGIYSGYVGLVQGQPRPGDEDGIVRFAGFEPSFFFPPVIFNVEYRRLDGGPDICEELPPPPPRPPELDFPLPLVWVGPNNIQFNVDATAAIGFIYVDADGNLVLPFNITIPVNISPEFKGSFDFDLYFNFGDNSWTWRPPAPPGPGRQPPGKPSPSPRPPRPDRDEPPPPEGVDPGEPPPPPPSRSPERRMVALIVRALSISRDVKQTRLFQDESPDLWVPYLGLVSFQIRTEDGLTAWTQDIPVKHSNQLVVCPWEGGAVDYALNAQPGVELLALPLYTEGEEFLDLFARGI